MNAMKRIGLLLALTAIFFGSGANAQDSDDTELEEIVVKGVRGSLARATEFKRNAEGIVDAVSAEDLGKFPDENIAESLQRVTGVQIIRLRGEGQEVNIRGLPSEFVRVQFNGHTMPSGLRNTESAATRNFDFTVLPSEFVKVLSVTKSASADQEEGGLAGTIDVRTPRPFDFDGRQASFSVQSAQNSNDTDWSPRLSGIYSDIFADGRFGVTLGAAFSKREPEVHQQAFWGYDPRSELNGFTGSGPQDFNNDGDLDDTIGIPFLIFNNIFREERERASGLASFQFRPSDNLELYADFFYTRADVNADRYTGLYFPRNAMGPVIPGGTTIVNDQAVILEADGVDLRGGSRFEDREAETDSIALGGTLDSGLWTIGAEIAISESTQDADHLNIATIANGLATIDGTVDNEIVDISHGPDFDQARLDPAAFRVASLNGEFRRFDEHKRNDIRFDVEREVEWGAFRSIEFGAKYSSNEQFHDQGRLVIGAAALSDMLGGLQALPGGGFSAASLMFVRQASSGRYLGAYSGPASVPQQFLTTDTSGFLNNFTDEELMAAGTFSNVPVGIIDVEEDVTAAYVKANFENDSGSVSGNVGIRYVDSDQESVGVAPDLTGIVQFPDAGEVTVVPAAGDIAVSRSYSEVLPSASLRIEVNDDVVARFAASRTLSRPALAQLSPSTTANGTTSEINQQNPFLDPFISNNLDASLAWYPDDGTVLSIAAFYKDIESLVRLDTTIVTLPITLEFSDGSTTVEDRDFSQSTPVNGKGVTLTGLELGFQYAFVSLPAPFDGFGIIGNYTYIDNSDPKSLTGSSENNYNFSAYYESDRMAIRLSYTWRDDFLLDPNARAFGDGIIVRKLGTLDANVTYNINDNFAVVIEAINLTEAVDRHMFQNGIANEYTDAGRRVLLGLRGSF